MFSCLWYSIKLYHSDHLCFLYMILDHVDLLFTVLCECPFYIFCIVLIFTTYLYVSTSMKRLNYLSDHPILIKQMKVFDNVVRIYMYLVCFQFERNCHFNYLTNSPILNTVIDMKWSNLKLFWKQDRYLVLVLNHFCYPTVKT